MAARRRVQCWALLAPVAMGPLLLTLGGCGGQNPVLTPVAWWHDLQGGAIAADRPPPPGADLPYPHIYSIPAKPVLPSESFRRTVETQLAQERDDTQRVAARTPIVVDRPPPPPPPPKPVAAPVAGAAPGDAAPADGTAPETANATLPGAEAPAAPPQAAPVAAAAPLAADGGPAPGTPLVIAGAGPDTANLPQIPDAPPPPATFEGMPALPAPSAVPPLPAHVSTAAQGSPVYFNPANAILDSSQTPTIKDAAFHRGKGTIEVEGHGDAASDAADGQEAALKLALDRAQAVAKGLEAQHVPAGSIRLSATAFGRGASIRFGP